MAVMRMPRNMIVLLMLHSKVRHGSSAAGTQGLKAHKMALSFCSKFKDGSQLLKTKEGILLTHPPISHSTGLPSESTPLLTPHPKDFPASVAPHWPHILHSCQRRHAMNPLAVPASLHLTLLHCHELHSSPPRSQRGWMVGENKFIYFCCKFFYTF